MKKGTDPRVRVGTAMAATPLPAWPTYPINTNTDAFYQTFDMTQSSSYEQGRKIQHIQPCLPGKLREQRLRRMDSPLQWDYGRQSALQHHDGRVP